MEDIKIDKDDQAKELRAILNELNSHSEQEPQLPMEDVIDLKEDNKIDQDQVGNSEMNVLNLPPRSVVHSYDKKKAHLKIGKPLVRLLTVATLLVIILGVYIFMEIR